MTDITMTPQEMIAILNDDSYREIASSFVELGKAVECNSAIRYAKAHKKWKCVWSKRKPKRVLYTIECDEENWSIKANLFHIDQYKEIVESCSDQVLYRIRTGYDCKQCSSRCKGGTEFELHGISYTKCIGCCFYFKGMASIEWADVMKLLEYESKY